MRKGWMAGFGVVIVVGGLGAVVVQRAMSNAGKGDAAKGPAAAASAPPLEFRAQEIVRPARVALPQLIEFSGPLVAPNTAIVRAKAAGTLLSLTVEEGARVAAGQALGRIDIADIASRIAERNAMVESARAALAQAERTHASNVSLAAQGFISPMAADSSRAALDTARAALAAAQASAETTKVTLRDSTLVAPIAGIVAKRYVVPGEKVSMEQQLLTIVDLGRLELAGMVGTHEVSRLTPGMAVRVKVEGLATPVQGKLARIAPAAEVGTRSIGVTVEVANPREALRAGQYAIAGVEIADPQPRLVVPVTAVGSTAGQDHVWLIESGTLMRRAVTLGRRDDAGGRVEVLGGIPADAQVLALRFDNLREGTRASVVADVPAVASSASGPAQTLR
jgi:membrane fusion protein, multidrug efflux system